MYLCQSSKCPLNPPKGLEKPYSTSMNQTNTPSLPPLIRNFARVERIARDDFWAYHAEISSKNAPIDAKYKLLRRRMISYRDRRIEAVRSFVSGL